MINTIHSFHLPSRNKTLPIFKSPHLDDKIVQSAVQSSKFKQYLAKIQSAPPSVEVSHIEIISVEMFSKGVGFINIRAITKDHGQSLPSYVFIRGRAVGVLLLINGKMLLVKQYRVPLQQYTLQSPAGMMDEEGDFTGVAAKQIEEETGIKITGDKLVELVEMISSGGGSDERITMYLCELQISQQQLNKIMKNIYGSGEHERIQLELIDFTVQNVLKTKDSKLLAATLAYHGKKKNLK